MVVITADTSTLYNSEEAKEIGLEVAPLQVTINSKTFKELNEINAVDFVDMIKEGGIPSSSQPAIGDVVELFESHKDDEIINISMADGLSGTYQSAVLAKNSAENGDHIDVINSKTLCGPHRYLAQYAVKMAKAGASKKDIMDRIYKLMETEKSYLIPVDFDFLKRGGRVSNVVGTAGKLLKLFPVISPNEESTKLDIVKIKRTFKGAVDETIAGFKALNVDENYMIYVTHAVNDKLADLAVNKLKEAFPGAIIEKYLLTPVFITQGGPGCVAIQTIRKEIA